MKVGNLDVTAQGQRAMAVLGPRVLLKVGTGILSKAVEIPPSDARMLAAMLLQAANQAEGKA